jgi:hypothetical protein
LRRAVAEKCRRAGSRRRRTTGLKRPFVFLQTRSPPRRSRRWSRVSLPATRAVSRRCRIYLPASVKCSASAGSSRPRSSRSLRRRGRRTR